MHKKILRILSLALAILLLVSVLPQEISANELEISEIRQQIISTYKSAKRHSGRNSFSGYCASLVNWQLYLMGITKEKVSNNGNQEYDYFSKLTHTSGGYRVNAYPSSRYSIEEALNQVSKDGTKDVYNMIVCFQSTNSAAGRRYGHAFFVHAIIDGVVYFNESSSISINGKYYAEGSAIACTIEEFCKYYAKWTAYEGLIYFGRKTYADECDYYSSNLYASITETAPLYSSPCTSEIDSRSNYRYDLAVGEHVHVTGLYENTEGEYWYEVDNGHSGFIPADKTQLISLDYSDVVAVNVTAPNNLRAGTRFGLKGQIRSDYNRLYTVRAQVYSVDGDNLTQIYSTTAMVDGTEYSLNGSSLSNHLAFRKLKKGTYLYKLAAVVGNYYYANGTMQLEWKTIPLWTSQFNVVSSRGGTGSVVFDANGGHTDLNQIELKCGSTLGSLPIPHRDGYLFAGWSTKLVGGLRVTEDTVVEKNMALYAQWVVDPEANGWYPVNGTWYYIREGAFREGFVESYGITYYIGKDGTPSTGWRNVENKLYYFNANGVMQTGLISVDGKEHLLGEDGAAITGWAEVNGNACYLNKDGSLYSGWLTIDGNQHYFDANNGALVMTHPEGTGPFHFIIHNQEMAETILNPILNFLPPMAQPIG